MGHTVVIGAGPAGLLAALRLAEAGGWVTLMAKGLGGWQLSQGTVDVLGYGADDTPVTHPFEAARALAEAGSPHPYAAIGLEAVRGGIAYLRALLGERYLAGDGETNWLLPTAVGVMRPTLLAPPSMTAGHLETGASLAIVGPAQLKDFYPELCAANLARTTTPGGRAVEAQPFRIDLPARAGEADSNAMAYARACDTAAFRELLAAKVRAVIGSQDAVGLPAICGLDDPAAWAELQRLIGRPVFEIPLPPPSVPGLRLQNALLRRARELGVRVILGSRVTGLRAQGTRLVAVTLAQAGRHRDYACDEVIYAAGGFESGAIAMDSYGRLSETIAGLPLHGAGEVGALLTGDYWRDQALFAVGLAVDAQGRVLDADGAPVYANLRAAGGALAGATRWSEKSGEGIALGSAWAAAEAIIAAAKEVAHV